MAQRRSAGGRPAHRLATSCVGLLLAGAIVGLCTSADKVVSLQKLAAILVAMAVFLVLGGAVTQHGILRSLRRRRILTAAKAGQERGGFSASLRMTCQLALPWLLVVAGVVASVAGNILIDHNAWKLNGLNQPVYRAFAHVPRLTELAINQNALAAFLILAIPFGFALMVQSRWRWLAASLTAILVLELLLTDSRAAMLSLGVAASLIVIYTQSRRRWLALSMPLFVAGALVAGALGMPSTGERLAIWQSALYMLADHPVTGIGLGMFQRIYPEYMLPAFHNTQPHAHNLFLQTWLDMGVLGVMAMVGIVAMAVTAMVGLTRQTHRSPVAVAAAISSAAVLLHAQVDSYFAGDPRSYWMMFIPLALLLSYAGSFAISKIAWISIGLPLLLLPLSNAGWLQERRLGLETGDPVYLRAALQDGPDTELAHFELAQALYASGDAPGAVQEWRLAKAAPYLVREGLYDEALAVNPGDTEAQEGLLWTPVRPALPLDKLGRAAQLAGREVEALDDYQTLSRVDPVGHYRLGELDLRNGRVDEAVTELEAAVKAIPNQEDFRLALAEAYVRAGDMDEAGRAYKAVLELDPGNVQVRTALGTASNDTALTGGIFVRSRSTSLGAG